MLTNLAVCCLAAPTLGCLWLRVIAYMALTAPLIGRHTVRTRRRSRNRISHLTAIVLSSLEHAAEG